jgi:signal recognition particle subunit SRP54
MFDFLSEKFSNVFSRITGNQALSESNIDEVVAKLHDSLLEADVPYAVAQQFIDEIKEDVIGQKVVKALRPADQFVKIVFDRLVGFLSVAESQAEMSLAPHATVLVMGLQGSGKTTSIAKLAYFLKKNNHSTRILVASVDFYRPAALEQLEVLAKKVKIDYFEAQSRCVSDAIREIQRAFAAGAYDALLVDTAGRLHVDDAMLQELRDIDALLQPSKKLLVLDAMTGQESLRVAQSFNQAVDFDGAVLTKVDSDARAGASFAFAYALKKPIFFVGTGEHVDELSRFYPDRAAKRILGMGDIESLLERAGECIKQEEQESAAKAFMSGNFSLADFAKQMDMMSRLGSLSSLLKLLPGMGGLSGALGSDKVAQGEQEMKRFRVIINSMTSEERLYPHVLNKSRVARIAKGAGVTKADVHALLDKFEQTKQFVKLLKKNKSLGNFFKY